MDDQQCKVNDRNKGSDQDKYEFLRLLYLSGEHKVDRSHQYSDDKDEAGDKYDLSDERDRAEYRGSPEKCHDHPHEQSEEQRKDHTEKR